MPDIEKYAPYIETIFSSNSLSDSKQKLPFSIADQNPLIVHSMIESLLNILKLLVIVPVFAFILQTATNWTSLLWAFVVFLLYPLVIKPIQYSLCAKYIAQPSSKENE